MSSAAQTQEDKSSIPAQLAGAQAWCDAENWELVKVYDETTDKGFQSGAVDNNERPYIQAMLQDARAGLFDLVIFKDNTRLGCDKLEAQGMANDLRKAGVPLVGFEALSRRVLDVTDDMDGLMFDFGQAQAQMDYKSLSRNMQAGKYRRAQAGFYVGGLVAQGYAVGDDKRLKVDEDAAQVVIHAFKCIAAGMSSEAAAKQLNERYSYSAKRGGTGGWSGGHVRSWLTQPGYLGEGFSRWMRPSKDEDKVECILPAPGIITQELWDAAHAANGQILLTNVKGNPNYQGKFALSAQGIKGAGRLFHDHSDGVEVTMQGLTKNGRRRYICYAATAHSEKIAKPTECPGLSVGHIRPNSKVPVRQSSINAAELEAQVLITLLNAASDPETMRVMVKEADRREMAAVNLEATVEDAEQMLRDIEADRTQVAMVARVAKKSEEWLVAELAQLDKSEAKARAILHRAKDARHEADRFQKAHDEVVAVFSARLDDVYVAVDVTRRHPDWKPFTGPPEATFNEVYEHQASQPHLPKKVAKVFSPDLDTPEGLRAIADKVLDDLAASHGSRSDLPKPVRSKLMWLLNSLDARVIISQTEVGQPPSTSVKLWAGSTMTAHNHVS